MLLKDAECVEEQASARLEIPGARELAFNPLEVLHDAIALGWGWYRGTGIFALLPLCPQQV